jgi:Tfp pilus assembly PilM family ATPase
MNRFVAIELLPDRMDVVLVRSGRVVAARRIPTELPNEPVAWCKALRSTSGALNQAVGELGAAKSRAVVLYRSPTQAVDLASVEIKSAQQAEEAASLDCLGGLSYSMESATIAAKAIGRDLAGEKRKTHVVVAADRTDVLSAIVDVVQTAGLRPEIVTPTDAAITSMISQRALRRAAPLQAWLYIGQQSSFFLIAGDGRVHFGRSLGLGIETLARTLTRPIRVRGREEPVELDFDTAASIIHRVGVPRGEQIVYEPLGLTGTQLRPLVQPVLQRYIVELRQSMRFSLPDGDLQGLPMTLLGPGGALAGFDELLEQELDVSPQRGGGEAVYDRALPGCAGSELHDAIQDQGALRALTVLPPELASKRRSTELRRWMWAGVAAAVVLIVLDSVRLSQQVEQAGRYAANLAGQVTEDEALKSTRLKLTNAKAALTSLESDIDAELSACVSFRAVLQELSALTPESVRLTNMTFSTREGRSVAALRGYAIKSTSGSQGAAATADSELKSFIEQLQTSVLIESVVLLNVERGALGSKPAESFQASVDLVSILPTMQPAQIVSVPESDAP